jgi:hypothetical protein
MLSRARWHFMLVVSAGWRRTIIKLDLEGLSLARTRRTAVERTRCGQSEEVREAVSADRWGHS